MANFDWRCPDPTCPNSTSPIPEVGDHVGYRSAKEHMKNTGHPPAIFCEDGQPIQTLNQTWAAWASKKRIFARDPEPRAPGDQGLRDDDELIGDDGRGDLHDDLDGGDDDDEEAAERAKAPWRRGAQGGSPALAGAYNVAISFPLSNRTLMSVDSHLAAFSDLYRNDDGEDIPYSDKLTLFFGRLVLRDMSEHPERYPVSRYVTRDALDDIASHYSLIATQLAEIDVRNRDLARRESALARLQQEQGGAPGGQP